MGDLYPELNGSYVRIGKWVTVEHVRRLGLMTTTRQNVYELWRDCSFFQVVRSYAHDDVGRVAELDLIRHSGTGLIWWNGAIVKWCWLELVAESELPVTSPVVFTSGYVTGYATGVTSTLSSYTSYVIT
jgi:hypothetical protein